MKKHISVFALYARSSLFPILALLFIMGGLELFLFWRAVTGLPVDPNLLVGKSIETLLTESRIPLIFGGAFVLLSVLLCMSGCGFGSRTAYTFDRLSISPGAIFVWQVVYNAVVYCIFWGAQLGLALLFCFLYVKGAPSAAVSPQSVFLAFNCSSFLRSLLPLEDVLLWGRNLLFVFALALSTARFPVNRRSGKFGVSVLFMIPTAFFFCEPLGDYAMSAVAIFPTVFVIGGVLAAIYEREDENETA